MFGTISKHFIENMMILEKQQIWTYDRTYIYPSLSKELRAKSIDYTKSIITIEEEVILTILFVCKSLLFDKTNILVKSDNSDFDVITWIYNDYWSELVELELVKIKLACRVGNLACFKNIFAQDKEIENRENKENV